MKRLEPVKKVDIRRDGQDYAAASSVCFIISSSDRFIFSSCSSCSTKNWRYLSRCRCKTLYLSTSYAPSCFFHFVGLTTRSMFSSISFIQDFSSKVSFALFGVFLAKVLTPFQYAVFVLC